MINGGPSGGGGALPFPNPPKGQPGAIRSIARSLSQAGHELERGEGQLRAASLTLETDWQGYAAAAYHRTAGSLGGMLRGGGETFIASASAVSGYAAELESTQSELKALKKLYDDALHRQAAATALASKLGTALSSAHKPAEQNRLNTQIGAAARQAGDALNEANGYARRADSALQSFKTAAARYQAVLEGQMPSSAPSLCSATEGIVQPGASFGLPGLPSQPGAPLKGYEGVLPTGPLDNPTLPGYGTYYDGTHGVQATDDLIVLATLVGAPGVSLAKALGERALLAAARAIGFGAAGREAVEQAGAQAAQEAGRGVDRLIQQADGSSVMGPGRQAARKAAQETYQEGQQSVRIELAKTAADGAEHFGYMPVPGPVRTILIEAFKNRTFYKTFTVSGLITARNFLLRLGTPGAVAAAGAVQAILSRIP